MEVETEEDGLGPAFNGNSCSSCHAAPAVGGVTAMTEIRAGRREDNGSFTELRGGTLFHLFSNPEHGCQVEIPREANVIARRAPTPLFGAGLIEAIPDDIIASRADPNDTNRDGVRGRVSRVFDLAGKRERVGRFGWKAQQATLLAFAGDAYVNEMGITNDLFPAYSARGLTAAQLAACGSTGAIEDKKDEHGLRGIDHFENFMKFLAPLPRGPVDQATQRGEALFESIGCSACHVPFLTTGPSNNPVFDRKPVPLYSDLLLHDVGTGDGIPQASAGPNELRTAPLWGLRSRKPLMHDGMSSTIDDAIRRHRREAGNAQQRYLSLSDDERNWLIAFLNSL